VDRRALRVAPVVALWSYVLALCLSLSPSSQPIFRHGLLATAITQAIDDEGALFAPDVELHRTAALLVAVAFRESSLDTRQVGDNGASFGAFQLHASSGGTAALLDDPIAQARIAHRMIKASIRADREHPIAQYARGPRFRSLEAQRISNDRMALSNRLGNLSF
jgi:hypothetical protein